MKPAIALLALFVIACGGSSGGSSGGTNIGGNNGSLHNQVFSPTVSCE
jgi:hypothetical protein